MNKVEVSKKVPCNNEKYHRYVIGYKVNEETIIPLFIKTLKNIFSYGVSQYDKNSACKMTFNVSKEKEWSSRYKTIWNEVEFTAICKISNRNNKTQRKVYIW